MRRPPQGGAQIRRSCRRPASAGLRPAASRASVALRSTMPELNTTPGAAPDPAGDPPPQAAATGSTSPKLSGAALWVAILAMATWIAFSIVLIVEANVNETEWTRLAWVFGSIQAIAFAAAGTLFGTAVQQQ